ncbi:DUF6777 domain-containing protein [Streptomyces sp. NPDC055144]
MSDRPTEPGRPTGPPSGPLSGPTQPASVPPPPPGHPSEPPPGEGSGSGAGSGSGSTGGGPGGTPPPGDTPPGGPHPDRPWWRFTPKKLVALGVLIVAAVVLTVVLTRSGGGGGTAAGDELFLQSADSSGPDPYTESSTRKGATATTPTALPNASGTGPSENANIVRGVEGSAPGLYGGTRNVSSCDVEKQIRTLGAEPDKNKAFASVLGLDPSRVPAYLRSLTPAQLRLDTRVTNHGFRDGAATNFQSVLQSGTAVLVNDRGEPRVRCSCGNPLLAPVPVQGSVRRQGKAWSGYKSSNVVVVSPAPQPVNRFVMYDPETGGWFTRTAGTAGGSDQKTTPRTPPGVSPSNASTASSSETSQSSSSQSSESSQPPSSEAPGASSAPPSSAESPAPESPASQPAS